MELGQLIADAIQKGAKKVILGLGGSCTNDAGCGMAASLGVKFYDKNGREFVPTGGTLIDVAKIDISGKNEMLKNVEIISMCDIDNTLYGKNGAAYVFAKQKGANLSMIDELDKGLIHISSIIKRDIGIEVAQIKGGGAAGGMGAGAVAFLDSELNSGIDTVLETVNFSDKMRGADMIFTGEGKFDYQSLMGKVIGGIAKQAAPFNIPVTVIAGGIGDNIESAYTSGITSLFSINRIPENFENSKHKSEENLKFTIDNILRLIKSLKKQV